MPAKRISAATACVVGLLLLEAAHALRGLHTSTNYRPASESKCKSRNRELDGFLQQVRQEDLLPKSTSYDEFVRETKASLDAHMLPDRAIHHIFSDQGAFQPYCDGDYMEFGVAYGATINLVAGWRSSHCGTCPYVHGFDTFTGLPEKWHRDDTTQYEVGAFDLEGQYPAVEPNVNLVKGLFNNSLPAFLQRQAAYGAADAPLSFLHVDCDLYRGAADVFKLLAHKIVPGTVIVFDDLVNYQHFREGEMLAWWEYLQASGTKVATIGMLGPLPGKDYAMELTMNDGAHDWFHQSAAFVVISVPGKQNPFEPREAPCDSKHRMGEAKIGKRRRDPVQPEFQSTIENGAATLHG